MVRKLYVTLFLVIGTIFLISTSGCTSEKIVDKSATEKTVTQTTQSITLSENFDYSLKENKYTKFLGKKVQTVIDEFGRDYTLRWDGGWSYITYKNVPFSFAYSSTAVDQNKLLKDDVINSIVIDNERTQKKFPINNAETITTMSTYGEVKSAGVEGKLYITEGDIYFFSFSLGDVQVRYRYDNIDEYPPVCVYFNLTQ